MPDDAKNDIRKALAYKRLQEHVHGKISGPEEIVKLWRESRFEEASEAILATEANEVLARQCPECHRILGEHSEEELVQCIRR